MDVITHIATSKPHNIKHPLKPWYVVSLEVPEKNRKYLGVLQRYTIAVASAEDLAEAHRGFRNRGAALGVTRIEEIRDTDDGRSFLLCDLNRNWWEIACDNSYSNALILKDGILRVRRSHGSGNPG
jgi:hypothetical protein